VPGCIDAPSFTRENLDLLERCRSRIRSCRGSEIERERPSSQRSPGNQACVALIGNCTPRPVAPCPPVARHSTSITACWSRVIATSCVQSRPKSPLKPEGQNVNPHPRSSDEKGNEESWGGGPLAPPAINPQLKNIRLQPPRAPYPVKYRGRSEGLKRLPEFVRERASERARKRLLSRCIVTRLVPCRGNGESTGLTRVEDNGGSRGRERKSRGDVSRRKGTRLPSRSVKQSGVRSRTGVAIAGPTKGLPIVPPLLVVDDESRVPQRKVSSDLSAITHSGPYRLPYARR